VGGVLPAGDDPHGRDEGHGRARLPVRVRGGGQGLGARLLQRLHEAARPARRLRHQPVHRGREPVHVRPHRRGGGAHGRGLVVLPVRPRLLQQPRPDRARLGRPLGGVPGVPGHPEGPGGPPRRAHRLAGDRSGSGCTASPTATSTR
jgi:hypothetical protein